MCNTCVVQLTMEKHGIRNELFELEDQNIVQNISDNYSEVTIHGNHVQEYAVRIRSACKNYGTKKNPIVVLNRLNMSVPQGSVYGLLGASGCGKTTLLSCILGLRTLDSGEILLLNGTVGSKGSKDFGARIGFMPQEMALYGAFTIRETLAFFGRISGMTAEKIEERMDFLLRLLMLPNLDKYVCNLSGGQQRRVSLATALLHEPQLLILDEPTVGLDSVLRENIWRHFLDITKGDHVTVLITTHYLDEAHRSDCIALMRNGDFLAEDSPNKLLNQYGLETLDALFFQLSSSQALSAHQEPIGNTVEFSGVHDAESSTSRDCDKIDSLIVPKELCNSRDKTKTNDYVIYNRNHMKALLWKNFVWVRRNIPLLIYILITPFVSMSIFWTCIGKNPVDVPIAVANMEAYGVINCEDALTCNSSQLSCYFLKNIQKLDIRLIPYDSEASAIQSVLKGKTYASISVKNNFSVALYNRVQDWTGSDSQDILSSEIDIFRDFSNNFVSNYLKRILYEKFQDFLRDYMEACGGDGISSPIKWETPVYGKLESDLTEFTIAGMLLVYISFLASYETVSVTMIERQEGLLERLLAIGINRLELLTSHLICQFVILLIQSTIALICLLVIFDVTMKGSILLVVLLTLLTGTFGIFFGLCLSCACKTEQDAAYIVVGTGLPILVLSGIVWPLEGMHPLFQQWAFLSPLMLPAESMRSIMIKGWDIGIKAVYLGFVSISMWTIFFLILSIVFLKFKKDLI